MGLPVPVDELPETLRRTYALNDLAVIAVEASDQVAVNDYAKDEVSDLAVSLGHVPTLTHARKLHRIYVEFCLNGTSGRLRLSTLDIVEAVLEGNAGQVEGLNHTRLGRDVLAQLHPDRQSVGDEEAAAEDGESATTFKIVENARATGDRLTAQGLYAVTVANIAISSNLSVPQLEKARYRAHLAKIASRSRFASIEEVDVWKRRMEVAAPYIARGRALYEIYCVFYMMLSGGDRGKLVLRGLDSENIFAGLDAAQKKYRLLVDEEAPLQQITGSIRLADFDAKFEEVFSHQIGLFKVYKDMGMITDGEASRFATALSDLCQPPPGYRQQYETAPVEKVVIDAAEALKGVTLNGKPVAGPASEEEAESDLGRQGEPVLAEVGAKENVYTPRKAGDDPFNFKGSKDKGDSSTASFIRFLDY